MELSVDGPIESSVGEEENDPTSRRPVDLVHLAKYTLGNRSAEREILELFSRQSDLYFERLRSAETDKAWLEAAHTILGSARGVGAWQVAKCAAAIQKHETLPAEADRDKVLSALQARIAEAKAFIGDLLKDV